MSSWLQDTPAKKIDTGTIRQLLSSLDASFAQVRTARQAVDRNFGTAYSPVREAQLKAVADAARAQITDLQTQIQQAFAMTKLAADAQRHDARRDFTTSSEGRLFRETLAAYGAVAGSLPAETLAGMINDAVASGSIGEARALSQLARIRYPANQGIDDSGQSDRFPPTALRQALMLADEHSRTPLEAAAESQLAQIDTAARRFGLFNMQTQDRTDWALDDLDDVAEGNFTSAVFTDEGQA